MGKFKLLSFGTLCDRSFQVTIQKVELGDYQFPNLHRKFKRGA